VTLSAGQNKSSELVLSALVRARFCELLSPKIQHGESDLFLLGLLSMMDSILEIPMTEVLDNVPIDQETKAVLLGGRSRLRPLYQLMLAQESGIGSARRSWQSPSSSVRATLPKFIGRQCNGPGRSAAGDLSVPSFRSRAQAFCRLSRACFRCPYGYHCAKVGELGLALSPA